MIGVNLAGAEFGFGRGVHGKDYMYPGDSDLAYFAEKGVDLVRLPFTWERMQPTLNGPLDAAELGRLTHFLNAAEQNGVSVVIDLHNYGRYDGATIGSAAVPTASFADFWGRLATALRDHPAVHGYGLMNEPHDMGGATVWPTAAQAAVNAIRAVDRDTTIVVAGDNWSSAEHWQSSNAGLRVADPSNNLLYEAHIYFDDANRGVYDRSYDQLGVDPTIGVQRLEPFLEWLAANNAKGFIGEFAVPADDPRWIAVLDNFTAAVSQSGLSATYWAGGPWWGADRLAIQPINGQDRPQMDVLERYIGQPLQSYSLSGATQPGALIGGVMADTLVGDGDNDDLFGLDGDDRLDGGGGDDHLRGGTGRDTLRGGDGNDVLRGGAGNDLVEGGAGADRLQGDEGDDVLGGQGGDDVLEGNGDADRLYGDDGNDVLGGQAGNDYLDGQAGADRLWGDEGDDNLLGGGGNDTLEGGTGNDTLQGGADNDLLYGREGRDQLRGGLGTDTLEGGLDDDRLNGDDGDDIVRGGTGNDLVEGGGGVDRLFGDDGHDVLGGQGGNDILEGGAGTDSLYGDDGDDILGGQSGNDHLDGQAGADRLWGDEGDDRLLGGAGADMLEGGVGNDTLLGHGDADVFVFGRGHGTDRIGDFQPWAGDRLSLQGQSYHVVDTAQGLALYLSGGGVVGIDNIEPHAWSSGWLI